ncbi:CO dehydrogenase/CO-methylating acetyl-CoA synthase complex subunit beta [Methanobrevibacter filiformis]|uniref:Acetyl-CoA decarbonylase/synthase complex subunit beta n=1 Tax=Methanobrevibacter filiformis TaxID=55758 RepID=A0A165Z8K1_9EURY|nr:CO dehydrogenase/CO-methylating acetyl-CoA synthase complex subunit beta [Methanobrevibacter filiformis]KZX10393.1 carbon monoxide dehydrogenase/acetyl-CoA synthase subunit alpha [Methanobrevibacter filiformis]
MFEDIPVEVSPMYEGERIRAANMFVELAGPKSIGAELVQVDDSLTEEKFEVIGSELSDMNQGDIIPFGLKIAIKGEKLEQELEGVIERRTHDLCNYVQGFMHLNQRDQIWCRVSTEAKDAGFKLVHLAKAVGTLFKEEFPIIETIAVTILTKKEEVEEFVEGAKSTYSIRDARSRELSDEDVDVFYGCLMCQSFAPSHMCVVTPDRTALCGAINWFDCRASAKMDPDGAIFEIEKGEVIDEEKGEYINVNNMISQKTQGETERVFLHSVFEYPHTSCGCFEAVAFYIPELDGIGIVDRDFNGETPLGIPFSSMAGQCSGGKQVEGFTGLSLEYMRSPKFLQADGAYNRVVWLPQNIKESLKEYIPKDLYDKIPTDADATKVKEIKTYLNDHNHPILERIANQNQTDEEDEEDSVSTTSQEDTTPEYAPVMTSPEISVPASGGVRIVFKNAKIYAEKVIIKKKK